MVKCRLNLEKNKKIKFFLQSEKNTKMTKLIAIIILLKKLIIRKQQNFIILGDLYEKVLWKVPT